MDRTLYIKTNTYISPSKWLLILLFSLIFDCCIEGQNHKARILFTGDILLSRNVNLEIEKRKTNPWNDLISRLKSEDLVIGNLEGTVGKYDHSRDSLKKKIIFDIPEANIPILKEAGFTAISLENNHCYDLGVNNRDSTIFFLRKEGIQPVTFNNSPHFFRLKDHVISIIAINVVPDKEGSEIIVPSIEIKQKLRLAKSLSEFVIVTIHWGSELLDWPNQKQRNIAKWLIDNGADLIIGHHPHVIQKPEIIDGKPVFFSLGNNLFDQKYPSTKEGLTVECVISKRKIKYKGILTHSKNNSYMPEATKKYHLNLPKSTITRIIKYSNIEIKPISVDDNGNRIILEGYYGNKKLWETPPINLVSIYGADFDKKYNYLFTLEKHYSPIDKEFGLRPYVYSISDAGLVALWRGSALSRPLLDAILSPDRKYLVALHRGDSFINMNSDDSKVKIEIYKWNGFGFSGYTDSQALNYGETYYNFERCNFK